MKLWSYSNIQLIEIIGIILAFFGGVFSTIITYRSRWRNYITKEFTVQIEESFRETVGKSIRRINFKYSINCTQSDEMQVNYIYLNMPKSMQGNVPQNPVLKEKIFGSKGKFYIVTNPFIFKHSMATDYNLTNDRILNALEKKQMKDLQMVINTNRYGDVKSNKIKF